MPGLGLRNRTRGFYLPRRSGCSALGSFYLQKPRLLTRPSCVREDRSPKGRVSHHHPHPAQGPSGPARRRRGWTTNLQSISLTSPGQCSSTHGWNIQEGTKVRLEWTGTETGARARKGKLPESYFQAGAWGNSAHPWEGSGQARRHFNGSLQPSR